MARQGKGKAHNESPDEARILAMFKSKIVPKLNQTTLREWKSSPNQELENAIRRAEFNYGSRANARRWFEDLAKGHMETIYKDKLLFDDKKVAGLPVEALMHKSVDRIQGSTNFNKQEAVYAKERAYIETYASVVKVHASGKNRKRFEQIAERVYSGREVYSGMRKDLKRIIKNAQKRIGENKK